ncbi:U11/U12 small nuclear ribonucleoprotein 48 kDa protein-like [Ylistrum balloti]|uniref:U11/U12 small nuclear ribonucleoprotein 48 kDa protein-like n=1 Tax=Ylistrum balloti TaxID=509963 RepID=UPI0029059BD6|nr:U11/U12 small nuclear ribonucleoprotein 48 kDa protein-like [Ylistrum balloti]
MDVAMKKESFINDLKQFVDVCQDDLHNVLQRVGWTPEKILEHGDRSLCPHDSNHVMPAASLEKHTAICPLLKKGYTKEEAIQQRQSNRYFYEGIEAKVPTVNIDQEMMNKILWDHHVKNRSIFYGHKDDCLTRDDQEVQLTAAERAALYEYVVTKAKEEREFTPLEDEFLTMNLEEFVKNKISGKDNASDSKPSNYLEYIKSERDYKRRRQTYRAKNVYTTKKSYTEVIRDVIENQTDLFASFMNLGSQENEDKEDTSKAQSHERTSIDFGSKEMSTDKKKRYSSSRDRSRERSVDRSKERKLARSRERDSRRSRNSDHRVGRSRERFTEQSLERESSGEIGLREEEQAKRRKRSKSVTESSESDSSKKHKKHHKKHKHKHKHKSK